MAKQEDANLESRRSLQLSANGAKRYGEDALVFTRDAGESHSSSSSEYRYGQDNRKTSGGRCHDSSVIISAFVVRVMKVQNEQVEHRPED